jgi:hypothetical protein
MADGMWGGCNLINSAIHCHIRNNYWHNFTAGGAIDYNMGLGPGDIHIHDNEWFGTFSGIIIRQCDTFWCNNNKLNGSGIVFTGEGHASSVQFSNMSIETAGNVFPVPNQPPYMIDFGTGTSPTFIQFNGGETAWFPTLFGNPLNVNGFAFSLLNTIATSDYPAGLIMGGWNSVTFPPGAAPPETYQDFSDFAGAANTSLSSVSTTGGGTFASILSAGNDVQLPVLSGNSSAILTAGSASTTYGDTYGTFTPPSADYTVSADFVPQNSTNAMGIFIRVDPTNDNAYLFGSSNGAGFYLIKIVAGASTVVQTYALGWATGVKYTLGIGINGSAISCTLNGSVVITATDSAISAAGHGGFRITGGSSATVTNYGIS